MRVTVDGEPRDLRTVWLEGDVVKLLDQRYLPHEVRILSARNYEDIARAIEDMAVRGAPAIGATAAYSLAQASLQGYDLEKVAGRLRRTRPTGQDLFHAIAYVLGAVQAGTSAVEAAEAYASENAERCRRIGVHGARLIREGSEVLTHCNAGALATVDYGTILAPLRVAKERGVRFHVYVSETRPQLQGSRLTAWELQQEGIDYTVVVDAASGVLLEQGKVNIVLVGADRVAANGDTANKIGTYAKAVLARENRVPFYVAAPLSTVDFSIPSGRRIPIEERPPEEVLFVGTTAIAPKGSPAYNPAFDVTPARFIRGIITEEGIVRPADLRKHRPRTR